MLHPALRFPPPGPFRARGAALRRLFPVLLGGAGGGGYRAR